MKFENLQTYKITFKQLLSGPAPTGRILNYLLLVGKGTLLHKKGNRNTSLKNNIGDAWCIEFMVGLGLVYYTDDYKRNDSYILKLTKSGKELNDELLSFQGYFDEGHYDKDIQNCAMQLKSCSDKAFNIFYNIYRNAPITKNVLIFCVEEKSNVISTSFMKVDFYEMQKTYYGDDTPAKQNAGFNRIPSFIQISKFFSCCVEKDGDYIFNLNLMKTDDNKNYFEFDEVQGQDETDTIDKIAEDLIARYGIDGTVLREALGRNSYVQKIFRENLILESSCTCFICKKRISNVMVASHIKPARVCNVVEKADKNNGLLLCATHDKLFNDYIITFDSASGILIYSNQLDNLLEEYQLSNGFYLDKKYLTEERKRYLEHHNAEFMLKHKDDL